MGEDEKRMRTIMGKINLPMEETPNKDGKTYSKKSVQEWVKNMRKLNEEEEESEQEERVSKETPQDQSEMENKFNDAFRDLDVIPKFDDLKVYNDFVFWSGTINGVIQFVFKVTENPEINGVELNYSDDIDIQNPKNNDIVERLEQFYKDFSDYWLKNVIQT